MKTSKKMKKEVATTLKARNPNGKRKRKIRLRLWSRTKVKRFSLKHQEITMRKWRIGRSRLRIRCRRL